MAERNAPTGIGFLGAGQMATALAQGLLAAGFLQPESIIASDVNDGAREAFATATGAATTLSNKEVVKRSSTVVLAVKPQVAGNVLREVQASLKAGHLLVSIAAGTTINSLTTWSGGRCRIIRVMPNTPCLVRAGASAFARGAQATEDDADFVKRLLGTVGLALELPERLLDAVTGLSGSGPAYMFQMIEALSDGGVLMGLPRDAATKLAAQTMLGAAKMVLETQEHPARLKDGVTSPGGTTIAGLQALEAGAFRGTVMGAVQAATERSQELSGI